MKSDSLYNSQNPFDTCGINLEAFYIQLSKLLKDTTMVDSVIFFNSFNDNVLPNFTSIYPSLDTSYYDTEISQILISFLDSANEDNLVQVSRFFENLIINSELSMNSKNIGLYYISFYKYSSYFCSIYIHNSLLKAVLQHDLDYFIKKRLKDIENGNYIDQLAFIAGMPESWLVLLAAAIWDYYHQT